MLRLRTRNASWNSSPNRAFGKIWNQSLLDALLCLSRVVVPIAVQQVIDRGLAGGEPNLGLITWLVAACAVVVLITAVAVFRMNVRLFRTTETALAGLRVRAFRHVHDLSVLTQNTERRGSLVSRVTSDVDTISMPRADSAFTNGIRPVLSETEMSALRIWFTNPPRRPRALHVR